MTETRKLAAILVADVVGFSRLAGADEERLLARLRALRSDLIDPTIAVHKGRVVKRTGDGAIVEFRSAVDAVRCALEIQDAMVERNAGLPEDRRIVFRIGVHVGDVVEESDGDLMGDGVNIAARLEGVALPGGICLSEDAYRQVKARLDLAITDMGETKLKNIAEPIRTYSLHVGAPSAPAARAEAPARLALPDKPSLVVLPFQNMSGDAEQDYFCDGMVEDITTALSRIKWLFVIARNSAFTYKGKAVDIRQVGRELGVRYVLEGGVRKAGPRLRVTGQLIEAETGAHVWADRYDGAVADVFDLQDQITEAIAGALEPNLRKSEIERARRKRPDSLDAYDLFLRALPHATAGSFEEVKLAIPMLQEALKRDPHYGAAHGYLAWSHEVCFLQGGFSPDDAANALQHAQAALKDGGDDAVALTAAALPLFTVALDFPGASGAIERALKQNSAYAPALYMGAMFHGVGGEQSLAEDYATRALRLSPFDPLAFNAHLARGAVAVRRRRYDEAAEQFGRAAQANPQFTPAFVHRAYSLALAGQRERAQEAAAAALKLQPDLSWGRGFLKIARVFSPEFDMPAMERGAREAGLPE
jgi:adenylate cyclase